MNLDPKIWGDSFWTTLFSVALSFPKNPSIDDKYHYKRYFYHLQYVLPCQKCRENMVNHIRQVSIDNYLNNTESMVEWLVIIHNLVNNSLKKPPISKKEAIERYIYKSKCVTEGFSDQTGQKNHYYHVLILLLLIVIYRLI